MTPFRLSTRLQPPPRGRLSLARDKLVSSGRAELADEVERELVLQTLARCDGNRTRAARVLGLSVRTLRNKIREYSADGIDVPHSEHAAA